MNFTYFVIAVAALFFLIIFSIVLRKKVPRKLKTDKFAADWKELQAYCKDKTTWPKAITEADKLLDKALKKRKFKGKRMGERIVSAQRKLTSNDQLWFAHNLAKKLIADPTMKLKESDVKVALVGFRQALRDLGALKSAEPSNSIESDKK